MPKLTSCQQCGAKLKLAPSGRRKRFCSYACRQAAFRYEMTANKAPSYPTKGYENCTSELIKTQNDFLSRNEELELSRSSARSSKHLKFERQNSVTYKLTDGQQVNTGGGRAARVLGYVMEVLPGGWMTRVRNLGNDLLPFGAAKQEAIRLYRCREKRTSDWLRELNLRTAAEIDRASLAKERRNAPIDLMGGGKRWPNPVHADLAIIRNIIELENCKPLKEEDTQQDTLNGDDHPLKYDENGPADDHSCAHRRNFCPLC